MLFAGFAARVSSGGVVCSRAGIPVVLVVFWCAAGPVRAQEAHEATLQVAEDSDPYPVVLKVNEGDRAILRADSRRRGEPPAPGPSPLEVQQAEMDLAACRAFFGTARSAAGTGVAARAVRGVRYRGFTTAAVEASGA